MRHKLFREYPRNWDPRPDGRVVVGGRSSIGVNHRLTIGRLTAAGALDTSFGDSGWTIVDRTATDYAEERVISLAIQADGKIVAGAHTSAGKLTLLRLWGEQAGRVYYLHDANHNVTGLADEAGQVLERYGYGAYGTVTVYDGQWQERPAGSAYGNTVLYGGYQWDAETALYCVRNRYYHPSLGRWIGRDPIGYGGGSNLYGYSGNDPVNYVDPTGTDRIEAKWENGGFNVYYVDEPSKWGLWTLGFNFAIGDSDPEYLGRLDPETGWVQLQRGEYYATMRSIREEAEAGGTNWKTFARRKGFGRTLKESRRLGIGNTVPGAAVIEWQQAEEMARKGTIEFNPINDLDTILKGTGLAADMVDQLLWFYATAPLDLAQTVRSVQALRNADRVVYAERASIALSKTAKSLDLAADTYRLRNTSWDRIQRLRQIEAGIVAQTKAKIRVVNDAAFREGNRVFGNFDPVTNTITLYKGHVYGTKMHELLHARFWHLLPEADKARYLKSGRDATMVTKELFELDAEMHLRSLGFIKEVAR